MNELEQEYIKAGCHIVNAIIESADISTEDGPIVNVTLKLPRGGVVFGGICFGTEMLTNNGRDSYIEGWDKGMTAILRIMQLAEVKHAKKMYSHFQKHDFSRGRLRRPPLPDPSHNVPEINKRTMTIVP